MGFLDKLYRKFNGSFVTDKEDTRFCEESKKMITPCGRIFKNETVSSVITRGAQHMQKDNFTLTSEVSDNE